MKIGILSMQRVINYGSFLQAYALKSLVEGLGHEAFFVDIRNGEKLKFDTHSRSLIKQKPWKHIFKRIEHVVFEKNRSLLFTQKIFNEFGISHPVDETEVDMIIIGSDEVFNCCQESSWGWSLQLFGDTMVQAISYAGSFGHTTYDNLKQYRLTENIAKSLKKLKNISVRDINSFDCIEQLTGIKPFVHLDPVLVYDWSNVKDIDAYPKNYILIYSYDNRINNEQEIRAIKEFAKREGKTLISCGVYQRWCDKNILCEPFELLSYFDHADYVITDTFHGTVISIKRNKQFATIIRDSNKNKLMALLNFFGLESRQVQKVNQIGEIFDSAISFDYANQQIAKEQVRTIEYLKENLKND